MVSEVSKGLMLCVSVSCPDFIGKTKGTKDRRDLPKSQKSVSWIESEQKILFFIIDLVGWP